jgi:hypothetical protein
MMRAYVLVAMLADLREQLRKADTHRSETTSEMST